MFLDLEMSVLKVASPLPSTPNIKWLNMKSTTRMHSPIYDGPEHGTGKLLCLSILKFCSYIKDKDGLERY